MAEIKPNPNHFTGGNGVNGENEQMRKPYQVPLLLIGARGFCGAET